MTEDLIEIDMYSVIKQKYIERDVLDKIKEEIKREREETYKMLGHEFGFDRIVAYDKCIAIIDKYIKEYTE